jgi:RNA polymerase sigma-B factor
MPSIRLQERSTEALIAELRRSGDAALRSHIIERHRSLVENLARKFVRAGVQWEDLVQAAWIALIRALDRYDPGHEARFSTYATHCIVGEIKRYFRDRTWGIKAPRYLQETAVNLNRMQDQLLRRLGREPTVAEMAAAFGLTEEELAQAMELQQSYHLPALEDRFEPSEGSEGLTLTEAIGDEDPKLKTLVEHAPLHCALQRLGEREQRILRRRFYDSYTQQEVAAELGLSQMHVSRLERNALRQLREHLAAELAAA